MQLFQRYTYWDIHANQGFGLGFGLGLANSYLFNSFLLVSIPNLALEKVHLQHVHCLLKVTKQLRRNMMVKEKSTASMASGLDPRPNTAPQLD